LALVANRRRGARERAGRLLPQFLAVVDSARSFGSARVAPGSTVSDTRWWCPRVSATCSWTAGEV